MTSPHSRGEGVGSSRPRDGGGRVGASTTGPPRESDPAGDIPLNWRDAAACLPSRLGMTQAAVTALFFPERGDDTSRAKRICESCPVQAQCLEDAYAQSDWVGIRGGMSERQRRQSRKGKGRPVAQCGTDAAYYRHRSRGEDPCEACRVAHSEKQSAWNRTRTEFDRERYNAKRRKQSA